MITAYVGLPGSGKSYGVVENVIVPALSAKREVWTNIPCHADALIQLTGATVTQFDIADLEANNRWFLDVLPKGAICILDEAWRLWPSGLKANKVDACHKEYMAEIRHLVNDAGFSSQLVIVTQDLQQLASFARTLIETTFRVVKLKAIGTDKRYRVDAYDGAVTGSNPPKTRLIRSIFGKYRSEIYALYKSHTKSDAGAGNEASIDKRATVFGNLTFKALPLLFIGGCWFLWYAIGELKHTYHMDDEVEIPVPSSAPAPAPGQKPASMPSPEKRGFFDGRETSIVFNMGSGGSTIYRFESVAGNSWVQLDPFQVRKLGYAVVVIDECLVFFERLTTKARLPVTCRTSAPKSGFLSKAIAGNVTGGERNERSD